MGRGESSVAAVAYARRAGQAANKAEDLSADLGRITADLTEAYGALGAESLSRADIEALNNADELLEKARLDLYKIQTRAEELAGRVSRLSGQINSEKRNLSRRRST